MGAHQETDRAKAGLKKNSMNNNKYLLEELSRELIQAYRRDFKEDSPKITWTDAVCENFASQIRGVLEGLYGEGIKKTIDHMVSESTVQRIVTGKLTLKDNIHAKTRHSLDNICLYLGYWNWSDFEAKKAQAIGVFNSDDRSKKKGKTLTNEEKERVFFYLKLLEEAKKAEFEMYKNLRPDNLNHMDSLKEYFLENAPEYIRIKNFCKRMFLGIFEYQGHRSRFTIDAGVMLDQPLIPTLLVKIFNHQEWLDKSTPLNDFYFSLYTFQYVTFTPDNKIVKITYMPTCKRDKKYVDSVYGSHDVLSPEEQGKPSPDMN